MAGAVLSAQQPFEPARYRSGPVPQLPAMVVGGGEVFLEVDVDRDGLVSGSKLLRTTPPFGDLLAQSVQAWQFAPAVELVPPEPSRGDAPASQTAVASRILVAAIFRSPTLNTPTLGEVPRDMATASDEVALPLSTVVPPYPPTALNGGVVLLEARVDPGGLVQSATVVRSSPPFDAAARAALLNWRFPPARWRGRPAQTVVYVMFGFAVPIG